MVRDFLGAAAATTVALLALNGVSADRTPVSHSRLASRQSASILQKDYKNGDPAPGARQGDAGGQSIVINGNGGHDSNSQRAGCDSIFIGSAAVGGSFSSGWTEMPQVVGFETKRDLVVDGGQTVQPYIQEMGKDASKIKRVIIVQPGLPRDYWKYSNLVRNSLLCASLNQTAGIDPSTILITAPAWLTQADRSAGAGESNDLYFAGGGWSTGGNSAGPNDARVSSFTVLDKMTEKFLNKAEYPALTSIYVTGHSLGGALTQRYAMLRKPTDDDANVAFLTGNPGAYAWPITDRPIDNPPDTSCANSRDDWTYGLSNLNSYARGDDRNDIASRYASRKVVYGLGLSDNEQGDTHCEAGYQGTSHLTRGQNMEKALATLPGGVPASHHFNYVANVAHEDYLILSDPVSQYYLFKEGIDTRAAGSGSGSASSSGSSAAASSTSRPSGGQSGSSGSSGSGSSSGSSGSGSSGNSGNSNNGALSAQGSLAASIVAVVGAAAAAAALL
ncbi:uncharacterized protein PFL1_00480 [Pseudozyma flocculosa PF-1]|uniref:Fungal lipase-like domain-containing protein n=1 Tax=Pseudozyma flocculosa TaxID=84751 RepID=A0A5C3EUN4_9BASI|nr:uncharacterized protein PFL1_00480 [Pseudozyma flocculosa PF-1]EPQ32283.1 hypothetical protein PFL1_00480 [Pseudozyma flocculosa PF-1]SPO34761.1 uncharacterized protein PSFLO_00232 [Pseudozyma flocculosa]